MKQKLQFNLADDQAGIYMVHAGNRFALRDSRVSALYAHEAALRGDMPMSIVNVGHYERLEGMSVRRLWFGLY